MEFKLTSNILHEILEASKQTDEVERLRRYIQMLVDYATTMENAINSFATETGGTK